MSMTSATPMRPPLPMVLPRHVVPGTRVTRIRLTTIRIRASVVPLRNKTRPMTTFQLRGPIFPLPIATRLPAIMATQGIGAPAATRATLQASVCDNNNIVGGVHLCLGILATRIDTSRRRNHGGRPIRGSVVRSSRSIESNFGVIGSQILPDAFFVLSFAGRIVRGDGCGVFCIGVGPRFPRCSPFCLRVLLGRQGGQGGVVFCCACKLS